MHTVHTTNGSL